MHQFGVLLNMQLKVIATLQRLYVMQQLLHNFENIYYEFEGNSCNGLKTNSSILNMTYHEKMDYILQLSTEDLLATFL